MNKKEVKEFIENKLKVKDEVWFSELVDEFCKSKGFEFFNDMVELKQITIQLQEEKFVKVL